jgi:hypothetical protein
MEMCSSKAAAAQVRPLSHGERVGVRGYGLSMDLVPSPGASRRPLPMGEVNKLAGLDLLIGIL